MGKLVETANTNYKNFLKEQLTRLPNQAAWDSLTPTQQTDEINKKGSYLFAIQVAQKIEDDFYVARSNAFTALDAEYQIKRTALQTAWQAKEDDGTFTAPN